LMPVNFDMDSMFDWMVFAVPVGRFEWMMTAWIWLLRMCAGAGKKPVKLSNQQKMIVQLLSQGYKRKDIIAKTGLSLGTVKSYTRIAFEKLEADNAASAVMRARELGIIK